ncbi:hypothetical protein B0H10DRAFT_2429934 [Mycena sp. CBHHK59/15]|nr:hypothetical protein B0H10DRAFT_2429934 [Mycena sp. CBHHK59/15]
MRTLAATWDDPDVDTCQSLWMGFLNALRNSDAQAHPHHPKRPASDDGPRADEPLDSVQTCDPPAGHPIFNIMHPYMYHVTHLARELSETVTGGAPLFHYARRHPLSGAALMSFVGSLRMLHTVRARVFDTLNLDAPDDVSAKPFFHVSHQARRASGVNIRACAHSITVGYSCLMLALEQKVALRAPTSTAHPTSTSTRPASSYAVKGDDPDVDPWRRARLALLRREVHALARNALEDVARVLAYLPSLPHLTHLQWSVFQGWGQFCLDCEEGEDHKRAQADWVFVGLACAAAASARPSPPESFSGLETSQGGVVVQGSGHIEPVQNSGQNGDFDNVVEMLMAPLDYYRRLGSGPH